MGVEYDIFFVIQGDDGSVEELEKLGKSAVLNLRWAFFSEPLGVWGGRFATGFGTLRPIALTS